MTAMPDVLAEIAAYKRREIAERRAERGESQLRLEAARVAPPRPFLATLAQRLAAGHWGLIAEIKKASPSKGLIREDFDPPALAEAYQAGGAACLSVLTDAPSFQGHESYLVAARARTGMPVLRKDFLFEPWQVYESRVLGADCILIIMAAVSDQEAKDLEQASFALGMDALVEVHNEQELERALRLKSHLIGINNRDLHSFNTDIAISERLAPMVPPERLLVAESGISGNEEMQRLAAAGIRAFLVGESLMRQGDVALATRTLLTPRPRI